MIRASAWTFIVCAMLLGTLTSGCGSRRVNGGVTTDLGVDQGAGDAGVNTDAATTTDLGVAGDAGLTTNYDECVAFCERNNACDTSSAGVDCATSCTALVTVHHDAGCEGVWDSMLTCSDPLDMESFCNLTGGDCSGVFNAWLTCVNTYCDAHMSDTACMNVGG